MARRVLVVEDSRAVNDLITEILAAQGYECAQAYDGAQALKLFEELAPDALVLDLNIPQIHGLEVLRQIKNCQPCTVVIVLTGHGSDQTASQAIKLGADAYLMKPLRQAALLKTLEIHLKRADQQRVVELSGRFPSRVPAGDLARLFFEAPAALIHVDALGSIQAANRSAARLLARSPDELTGQPFECLLPEELRGRWLEAVRREMPMSQGYEGEVLVDRPGSPFPAGVVAIEQPERGHLILSLRDLTHQKALERRYFESKRLASLGRVVEGVAHEVRNPLVSIGGFARKLRQGSGESGKENQYLSVILAEVERLERMVRDIEGFVQFSTRDRSRFAPVDLRMLLEACVASVLSRSSFDGVRLRSEVPDNLPAIYGNEGLLRELFDGLVENACESMPSGGSLSVSSWVVDRWVQVQVEDTGVGIPEEDLDEIFDPFFTSKTSGAGLGLAKAYLIVEEHTGTIDFESRVGKGTVCTVSLPVDRRQVRRGPVPVQ